MPDNYSVLDSAGLGVTIASKARTGGEKGNRVYLQVLDLDVATANPMPVALVAGTAAVGTVLQTASTTFHALSAATTNATSVKGSAGVVTGFTLTNTNAAARSFKLFNKVAAPVAGTDTPVKTVVVPGGTPTAPGVAALAHPVGLTFPLGIGFAVTGLLADLDATAVTANDLVIDLDYR